MQKHVVKRTELLAVLRKNREAHRGIFLKACEGYKAKAIKELEGMLDDARKGYRFARFLSLPEPVDQTREYDRAIRAMEMDVREEIELSGQEFAQYVMDDWGWKQTFTETNAPYFGGTKLSWGQSS